MSSEKIHRIPAFLAALVLAAGLIVHDSGSSDIIVESAMTAASDMLMPGKCSGCAGDEKGVAPTACSACCAAVMALPLVAVVLYAVPAETLKPTAGPDVIGLANAPDPHPPRPIILS